MAVRKILIVVRREKVIKTDGPFWRCVVVSGGCADLGINRIVVEREEGEKKIRTADATVIMPIPPPPPCHHRILYRSLGCKVCVVRDGDRGARTTFALYYGLHHRDLFKIFARTPT